MSFRSSARLFAAFVLAAAVPASAQQERKTPYWASISSGEALMRTGPGRNFPGTWLYRRENLPIKIVEVYKDWRRVQDPSGTTGWMLFRLLSDTRTGIVTGSEPRALHAEPDGASRIAYRAAPGVVGRISKCKGDWCLFDAGGRKGYIRRSDFWGTDPGEAL